MSARAASRPRRRRAIEPGVNLAPLLDAIFNLVFFFLLATTLRTEELQTEITLPGSETAAEAIGTSLAISVDADGNIYYEGRTVGEDELELELMNLKRRGVEEVTIRGDANVGLGRVYDVMDVCRRVGLQSVSLVAKKEERE